MEYRPKQNRGGLFQRLALLLAALFAASLAVELRAQEPAPDGPSSSPPSVALPSTAEPASNDSPRSTKNLLAVLRDGGPMMIPLAVCSFALFVFVFERAISLRRGRVIPRPFVRRFLDQLNEGELERREALARCRENRSPVAEVFAAGVMKWNRPAVEVEQAIIDAGERVANGLRRYLRLFNGISTVSPLLGLLGTVSGMIRAFSAIATSEAMGRQELLASSISEALLTTAAGLSIAIPAIVAHLYFSSRVDQLVTQIDTLSQQVVNAIASDTWRENSSATPRTKAA
jgi:biopolymer transport protein ExbB